MTTPPDSTRDTAPTTEDPSPKEREAPARLSLTQVLASSLAAVSTTVLLSYFGTAGTIIGAGIASALTVVANYVYTRSIQKTREQLVPVVGKVVQVTTGTSVPRDRGATARVVAVPRGTDPAAAQTVELGVDAAAPADGTAPTDGTGQDEGTSQVEPVEIDETALPSRWLRLVDRYGKGRVLTVTALALFVVVMGVVLVVELAIGKPISDAVRGQEGSGTSISRTTTAGDGTVTPSQDQPSDGGTLPAEDPSSVPTGDAPTDPAPEPTQEPTDEPTDSPSPSPTEPTTPDGGETGGTGGTGTETGSDTGGVGTGTGGTTGGAEDAPSGSTGSTGSEPGTSGGSAVPDPAPTTSGAPAA